MGSSGGGRTLGMGATSSSGHQISVLAGPVAIAAVTAEICMYYSWKYMGYPRVGYVWPGPYYGQGLSACLAAGTASAEFVKKPELTLEVTVEGAGGSPKCAGYVKAQAAKKYYAPNELVMLTAESNPGYVHTGWKGDGVAWLGIDQHGELEEPAALKDITESEIYIEIPKADEPRLAQVAAVFRHRGVRIISADLCEDEIILDVGELSIVTVTYTGPNVADHELFLGILSPGEHTISFSPESIPVGEFTDIVATTESPEPCSGSTYPYHIQNLGGYRHTQYNTPDESLASCNDGTTTEVCLTDASCNYTTGVMLSNPFAFAADLNGSGLSLSHGFLSREAWCNDPAFPQRQVDHPVPSECDGYVFRPTATPSVTCGGEEPVPGETVARRPNHPNLTCGDTVFIPGVGCKIVSDEGGGLSTNQLDHYTANPGCGAAIGDLVPNPTNTFKIFDE